MVAQKIAYLSQLADEHAKLIDDLTRAKVLGRYLENALRSWKDSTKYFKAVDDTLRGDKDKVIQDLDRLRVQFRFT